MLKVSGILPHEIRIHHECILTERKFIKLRLHMAREHVSWAILYGGAKYMVVFLEETDEHHHELVVSKAYETFTASPSPSLASILLALLLSEKGMFQYKKPGTVSDKEEPLQSDQPGNLCMRESQAVEPSPLFETVSLGQRKRKRKYRNRYTRNFHHVNVCIYRLRFHLFLQCRP